MSMDVSIFVKYCLISKQHKVKKSWFSCCCAKCLKGKALDGDQHITVETVEIVRMKFIFIENF